MAEENTKIKEEEVVVDEAKVEETKVEEKTDEIPKEILDANNAFDAKMDSEEDDTAVEEEKDDEEVVAEKNTVVEDATEQTAEEKEIEAEATALEEEILKDAAKETVRKRLEDKAEEEVKAEKKAEEEDKPFDCGLSTEEGDDGYDKDLVATINKIGQDGLDKNKKLAKENAELQNIISQQANDRHIDWLDRKVSGLGEDFHKVLGDGDFEDLEPASDEFENRIKIGARMNLVVKTYQKMKKPVPSKNKLFSMAVNHLFKTENNKAKTDKDTKTKLAARAKQVIGKGSKKASQTTADAALKKSNDAFDRKMYGDG